MKISEVLKDKRVTVSMEVFPPKTDANFETVEKAVDEITAMKPAFISCTYGAGGGTSAYTVRIAKRIGEAGVSSMAHLTCVSSARSEVKEQITRIKEAGIENILALRGDIPEGSDFPGPDNYAHASDLIGVIKEVYPEACIGGACYPEKHPEARDKREDIQNLKKKVDAGAEYLMSQLFFDNGVFYDFLEKARIAGIDVPIEAGIMPVVNARQITRLVSLCGASIPPKFAKMMARYEDDPEAIMDAGIAYAVDQIVDLLSQGVDGIHLYTMNKPEVARRINDSVKHLFKR